MKKNLSKQPKKINIDFGYSKQNDGHHFGLFFVFVLKKFLKISHRSSFIVYLRDDDDHYGHHHHPGNNDDGIGRKTISGKTGCESKYYHLYGSF